MYPITRKEKLADRIFLMDVKAPRVARYCLPGQFIIAKIDEAGERIPLTICDYDREQGTITIVFQTVGASTERMSWLEAGDAFEDFVGPLVSRRSSVWRKIWRRPERRRSCSSPEVWEPLRFIPR